MLVTTIFITTVFIPTLKSTAPQGRYKSPLLYNDYTISTIITAITQTFRLSTIEFYYSFNEYYNLHYRN